MLIYECDMEVMMILAADVFRMELLLAVVQKIKKSSVGVVRAIVSA